MATVVTAAPTAVATATALNGRPAADRIAGLTNRMYDIVRNVLTPPSSSIRRLEPRAPKPKRLSRNAATRTGLLHESDLARPYLRLAPFAAVTSLAAAL